MLHRIRILVQSIRELFAGRIAPPLRAAANAGSRACTRAVGVLANRGTALAAIALAGAAGYALYRNPPFESVGRGEVGVRTNTVTGSVSEWRDGSVLVLPIVHRMRVYPLRDQTYRPEQIARADGPAPLQSVEGLSFGVDLAFRYALDPTRVSALSKNLPDDIAGEIVAPAVQSVVYKVFARHTVREIFSTRREEIQQAVESELAPKLAADGILLRSVQMGKVDLPADYRRGMEGLLAEGLAAEKMRYTLELKDKRVREIALDAEAEKVRREKIAEAAAREQIIAARAQEEAMKHVLPFKQRQIEQRRLEAEADKAARVRIAEGAAQARRIEATGEADARSKLADAEAYRMERLGKVSAEQLAREGALIEQHPLLIQKALADKLSDKVQVIIAPPPGDGGFIGANLLGSPKRHSSASTSESTHAGAASADARVARQER